MRKVLIITYYWPPSGGSGVQRWLKFVKYLRDYGWEPIVYTALNGEYPELDFSLEKDIPAKLEVIKTPIWEPYSFYKKFIGQKREVRINSAFLTENKKPKFTENLSVWIRGNFFIPDARKFWINPSIKYLNDYLKKTKIDAVVSTGPPHSMHLIAKEIAKKNKLPWLADFRDPWTNIDFYKDLRLTSWADRKHRRLEKSVLESANAVTVISRQMKEEFENILGQEEAKIKVITNGYDTSDVYTGDIHPDSKFSIAHIGTLVKSRNPLILWKVLGDLVNTDKGFAEDLEIKLVGKVDHSVVESLSQSGLTSFLKRIDYVPHAEVVLLQQESQLLLLLLNNTPNAKGILTGKFFEYLSAGRPILAIGPVDGDAAKILFDTQSGRIVGFNEEKALKDVVLSFYKQFKEGELKVDVKGIEKYSRKSLTGEMAALLTSIAGANKLRNQ